MYVEGKSAKARFNPIYSYWELYIYKEPEFFKGLEAGFYPFNKAFETRNDLDSFIKQESLNLIEESKE